MISLVGSVQKSAARPPPFYARHNVPGPPLLRRQVSTDRKMPARSFTPGGHIPSFSNSKNPLFRCLFILFFVFLSLYLLLCILLSLSFSLYSSLCIFYSVFFSLSFFLSFLFLLSVSFSLYSSLCIFFSVFFCAIIMAVIRRFSCPSYRLISPGTSSPSTGSPDFSPAVSPQRKPSPSLPCAPQSQSRWHSALPALPLLWYL